MIRNPAIKHWTEQVKPSYKLLRALYIRLGKREDFTNADAYKVYDDIVRETSYTKHLRAPEIIGNRTDIDKTFRHMNVRNQLCKFTRLNVLTRIRPGVYSFGGATYDLNELCNMVRYLQSVIDIERALKIKIKEDWAIGGQNERRQ